MSMDAKARGALTKIRRCMAAKRYRLSMHFTQRMDERCLFWADVLVMLDDPTDVRSDGLDRWGRPKWIIAGQSASGDDLELVCVLDQDERGNLIVFITIY